MNNKMMHMVAFVLLVIGGLNWLLVVFDKNLVEMIFGDSVITTIIYALVGLAALYEIVAHKNHCSSCRM